MTLEEIAAAQAAADAWPLGHDGNFWFSDSEVLSTSWSKVEWALRRMIAQGPSHG